MPSLSLTFHVVCSCQYWDDLRRLFWLEHSMELPITKLGQVLVSLGTRPGQKGYEAAAKWASRLDRDAKRFWGDDQ